MFGKFILFVLCLSIMGEFGLMVFAVVFVGSLLFESVRGASALRKQRKEFSEKLHPMVTDTNGRLRRRLW